MTTAYTSLLGLALPVTGELSGTWGDTVNDYITQYLDASVAGTQTISGSQTAVTLSKTTNASLSQAGSGATGSSQYNVINCTGNPASLLTVTVPAASKTYVVVNATSTNQDVKIVGAGPTTGVTLVAGERAIIAWNGSDFIKVATSTVDGVSTIAFGTTGLTPSSATSGAVTVAGTLVAANGGTGQSSYTTGDLLYATGSTALSKLGIGTNGQILTSTGTAPQWSTLSGVAVTTFSAGTTGFTPSSATSGAITLAGTLATTNGGTGLTSFTANGVVYASSSSALTTGSALTFNGSSQLTVNGGAANTNLTASTTSNTAQVESRQDISYSRVTSSNFLLDIATLSNQPILFTVNNAEVARLTSTGLGIGTSSPGARLHSAVNSSATSVGSFAPSALLQNLNTTSGAINGLAFANSGGFYSAAIYVAQTQTGNAGDSLVLSTKNSIGSWNTGVTLDTSGNLGLGVTPSAWGFRTALQIGSGGSLAAFNGGASFASNIEISGNSFLNASASRIYIANDFATLYRQEGGIHSWLTAPSGTAGNTISFTQAMTLDASGNLGVGTTSPSGNGRLELNVPSGNNTNLTFYENGASRWLIGSVTGSNAFRFYDLANATERFQIAATGAWGLAGANYGTSGQVLTSNGSGSAPTWQNAGGSAATPTALGTVYGLTQDASGTANTVLGYQGLNANTTGNSNVSAGVRALYTNTTGSRLTALGYSALYNSTTSSDNTAVGSLALLSNTTGAYNTAVGSDALRLNTTASYNTANGYQALYSNTTAQQNSAVGSFALYSATTGGSNTAVGYNAGTGITTGVENTFLGIQAGASGNGSGIVGIGYQAGRGGGSNSVWIGYNAGQSTSNSGTYNVGMGFYAGVSNTSGQSNVFLGYQAGQANTTGSNNVFIGGEAGGGTGAGHANTTASGNVAVGASALKSNTTAGNSVAVGYQSLYSSNRTADANANNAAVGYRALYSTTTGDANTALGFQAGYANTTGTNNVAIGVRALDANTTAEYNTAVGADALGGNTTGTNNVAVGALALYVNTTGADNTAVGYQALDSCTTGNGNVAIGSGALSAVTTPNNNIAIGRTTGNNITTGAGNVLVGEGAVTANATDGYSIVIGRLNGNNIVGKGDSTGFISPNSGGVYQGNNSSSWSTTSDRRLKKNIVDNNEGLDKIAAIRVRNFEYRTAEEVTELPAHTVINKTGVQLGVIAQELQQVCPDCVKEESTGVLSVDSDNVFWHMVNAIKQLNAKVEALQAEITTLKGA